MEMREIKRRIRTIAKNTASMNVYIQETAVAIIEHASVHGNCTAALDLVKALPKSYRRGLLINWFAKWSPIAISVAKDTCHLHKSDAKAFNPFNLDGAKANNWFEGEEADKEDLPDTTVETAQKSVWGLINRLQKRIDDGHVPAAQLPGVEAMIADLKATARKDYPTVTAISQAPKARKQAAAKKAETPAATTGKGRKSAAAQG